MGDTWNFEGSGGGDFSLIDSVYGLRDFFKKINIIKTISYRFTNEQKSKYWQNTILQIKLINVLL